MLHIANDEESHVPTADRVARVFSGEDEEDAEENEDGEEPLEEIDFSEIGRLQAEVDAAAKNLPDISRREKMTVVEEKFTGFYIDPNPAILESPSRTVRTSQAAETALADIEDEVIVYVAPHPRAGPITPPPQPNEYTGPYTSILTGRRGPVEEVTQEVPISAEPVGHTLNELASGQDSVEEIERPTTTDEPMSVEMSAETDKPGIEETATPSIAVAPTTETIEVISSHVTTESINHSSTIDAIEMTIEAHTSETADTLVVQDSAEPASVPTYETFTFSFPAKQTLQKKMTRKLHPVRTPKALRRPQPRRKSLHHFGVFGAQLEEAHLHEGVDPRKSERRTGDSDLDWGSGSEDEEEKFRDPIDELSNGVGDMTVDEGLDEKAMARFVMSMSAEGSRHVTMDDLDDEEQMKREDEEESEESSEPDEEDSELEAAVREEEDVFVASAETVERHKGPSEGRHRENSEDEDEDIWSDDDEETPRRGFQARLERIRKNAEGKKKAETTDDLDNDDEDDDAYMSLDEPWADRDEDYIDHIQAIPDKNADILNSRDRKTQTKLFNSIRDGKFGYDEYEQYVATPAKRKKTFKETGLPPDMKEQWEKDRATKAENKRKRQLDRLEAAADPLAKKKGGKKGHKAMLAAARLEEGGPITLLNRIVNLSTLEQQIRRFIDKRDGPSSMSLPPCDKDTRRKIHEMAIAFNLKSFSKGKGTTRYITLTKTSYTGTKINEKKVKRIMREDDGDWGRPGKRGKTQATSLATHREGEEVGKTAPKIGESNVGFKLLAAMGWAEGERIGLSGGIDAPLVAKMKKTKLGLGATMS
ncbi:hypothetical protein BDY19DRAFT_994500 [Irpex rosettiformis]|uniref:Uncharacterized protein n=1 Tax=Irpex rosettiformis TaxID=378272 RepID=A0ACB8U1Y4_9APHY|nr:hypothetical protein BDY19DRAFT_994500 [Irpex rosettiformis]